MLSAVGAGSKTKPSVTVIVPCFNAGATIHSAIASVLSQSWQTWNLIVVDDGSTDSSREMIHGIQNKEGERIRILSGKNRGACHARNRALKLVEADYVAFLDSDDRWHPQKLEQQVEFLSLNPQFIGVTTGYRSRSARSGNMSKVLNFSWQREDMENWTLLGSRTPALNSTLLVRFGAIDKAGGYDESLVNYAEDLDLAWRLLEVGPMSSLPACLVTIGMSESQIHRDFKRMGVALTAVYRNLSRSEPGLASLAMRNLQVYLRLRQFLSGANLGATLALLGVFVRNPIIFLGFLARKLRDFGRVHLRWASPLNHSGC